MKIWKIIYLNCGERYEFMVRIIAMSFSYETVFDVKWHTSSLAILSNSREPWSTERKLKFLWALEFRPNTFLVPSWNLVVLFEVRSMHLKIVYFLYSKKDYSEIHRYTFLISRYSQVNCRLNSVMCWSQQQSRACGKCNPQERPLKNTFRDLVHVLSLTIDSTISCLLPWLIISLAQPVHDLDQKRFVTEPFVEPPN